MTDNRSQLDALYTQERKAYEQRARYSDGTTADDCHWHDYWSDKLNEARDSIALVIREEAKQTA